MYEPEPVMAFEKTPLPHPDDTIVAVSSALGPAERAIVRLSGPNTRVVVEAVFRSSEPCELTPRHLRPGFLRLTGVHSPVPASLYFFPGPHSYTGQDLAELHTIGSPPLVERLVADLLAAGARSAQPGEFTLRAFLAGKKNLPQAEAVRAIIEARSDTDLQRALNQLSGGLTQPLNALRDDLLNLLADLEAALDFVDENIEFVGPAETLTRINAAIDQLTQLEHQLEERTLSGRPVRVALVGLPNAGKSSLFNALAGGNAIVSPIPGTTRDYLTKQFELDGVIVELIDTAGWQAGTDTIEDQAQKLGRDAASQADVIVWCDEYGFFSETDGARLEATGAKVLRVWTKSDRVSGECQPSELAHTTRGSNTHPTLSSSLVRCSVQIAGGTDALRETLRDIVLTLAQPALAPSQSRCRHHVAACADHLRAARDHVATNDPPELAAAALRAALDQLGELTGAVFTNDLLDRIFSRFCIGK
jgi:tRNA modification GTPase